jgi:hypothetical protein
MMATGLFIEKLEFYFMLYMVVLRRVSRAVVS